ncbi:uncharacterized protein LOC131651391 [Vicia villosa]|uniref:uncharacterized protein LOC131651391 n=1 Tax=Vicia villosa TaxID=3911 RepID=UPI00273B3B8E|nr:uncharacterized protein LOC131651391 [Vicia villosa]
MARVSWEKPVRGDPMHRLWIKLHRLKADVKKTTIGRVKQLSEELIKLHNHEEARLIQRTKINWIRQGDENSHFFYAYLKSRQNRNCIKYLQRDSGDIVSGQSDMEKEVMDFYSSLMGDSAKSIKYINIEAMREGKQLEVHHKLFLEDVREAVNEFFSTGMMHKQFNKTVVTLIPKGDSAKSIRDFRPIAGCTIFLKIVSKVITARMRSVMPEIINKNQAAFVAGQDIHNHIHLAYELIKGYGRKKGTPRCMFQIDLQKAYDMCVANVLNAIPIYSLSFYRAPKKVLKEIVSIQRKFLWRGVDGGGGINWVSWRSVCKPKAEGGLSIRDVDSMNVSLLMKWKWRIMTEENAIWSNILKHRYSKPVVKMFVNDKVVLTRNDSIWWRNLLMINDCAGSNGVSISDLFFCRVNSGENVSFWFSKWAGNQVISEAFPELYNHANNPCMTVADAGFWQDGTWVWDSDRWIRNDDEETVSELLEQLVDMLPLLDPASTGRDEFNWAEDDSHSFTVKDCVTIIKRGGFSVGLQEEVLSRISFIWKLKIPSKVGIFLWRFSLARLPTKDQLKKRGILNEDSDCCCVFCFQVLEDNYHLFDGCTITRRIWHKVGEWIGTTSINLSNEELRNFPDNFTKIKVVDERLTVGIIWSAVLWNLWIIRNSILFSGNVFTFDECYSAIVLTSWKWFRSVNDSSTACNFHFWNILPLSCIKR